MADYTSIQIIKKAPYVWVFSDNKLPSGKYWISNAYQDIIKEDLVSFTTRNGANIYNNEPYSIYSYIDELDSGNNFTPTSAEDLHTKLVEREFFGTNGGGGGSTPTLQGLANSLFGSLFGRGGQVVLIDDSELGFTTAVIDGLFQNNVARTTTYYFTGSGQVTASDIANKVNNLIQVGNPNPAGFTISELQTPVIMSGVKAGVNYVYVFKKGKGTWGTTVNPVDASDFKLISFYNTTPDDINPDDIIPLGTIADGDYVAQANLTEWNFSDSGTVTDNGTKQYFFSYTTDGVLYIVQFVGEPGIYGGEETPFTEEDFEATTNSAVVPAQDLQSVTDAGNVTSNPIRILDEGFYTSYEHNKIVYDAGTNQTRIAWQTPVATVTLNIPAKSANDTFAMLSDLAPAIVTVGGSDTNTLQSNSLIGANEVYKIETETDTYITPFGSLPDFAFDNVTGTITISEDYFYADKTYLIYKK